MKNIIKIFSFSAVIVTFSFLTVFAQSLKVPATLNNNKITKNKIPFNQIISGINTAQNNNGFVNQAIIGQYGNSNSAFINQVSNSSNNYTAILQTKNDNNAVINQKGNNNSSKIEQNGDYNGTTLNINGNNNKTSIYQGGTGNQILGNITGNSKQFGITQEGINNTLIQSSINEPVNGYKIYQKGTGMHVKVLNGQF